MQVTKRQAISIVIVTFKLPTNIKLTDALPRHQPLLVHLMLVGDDVAK